jgi:hypothetical protein
MTYSKDSVRGWQFVLPLILTCFALIALPEVSRARPNDRVYAIREPYLEYNDVGTLELELSNVGVLGNPGFVEGPGAGWEGGEYLYASGLWIAAIPSDQQPHVSTGAYEFELRPTLDLVDHLYLSREGWPGGNHLGMSYQADDDHDGYVDEDFHNGKDDDGDGAIDEDFSAVSEQMYSCEYWDYTPEAIAQYPQHHPLNVFIRQRSLAWSETGIDDFVGVAYSVVNVGNETLQNVYLGFFTDGDCGLRQAPAYWSDDGGFWMHLDSLLVYPGVGETESLAVNTDLAYMYDTPVNAGDNVDGFFGILLLDCRMEGEDAEANRELSMHTIRFFSGSAPYPQGDPRNDAERYAAMSLGTQPAQPTATPNDYRYIISVGPIAALAPGEKVDLVVAYIAGLGYYDALTHMPDPSRGPDGLPSDRSLLANALRACKLYHGYSMEIGGQPETQVHWVSSALTVGPVQVPPSGPRANGVKGTGSRVSVNPRSAPCGLSLELDQPASGQLCVYDLQGRRIRMLGETSLGAGRHELGWDGRNDQGCMMPGGVYFLRFAGGRTDQVGRFLFVRGGR